MELLTIIESLAGRSFLCIKSLQILYNSNIIISGRTTHIPACNNKLGTYIPRRTPVAFPPAWHAISCNGSL